jgi:hypothetical protein
MPYYCNVDLDVAIFKKLHSILKEYKKIKKILCSSIKL